MKKVGLMISILTLTLLAAGCQGTEQTTQQTEQTTQQEQNTQDTKIAYSNLVDLETQKEVSALMDQAGISPERQKVFFDHVNQFNQTVGTNDLVEGFSEENVLTPSYDPYAMQDTWNAAYPDFLGYNCRITSYGLFGDYVNIPEDAKIQEDMVLLDLSALQADDSAFPNDIERFAALYSTVETDDSKDIETHVKNLQKDWKERGISFEDNPNIRLISVVFHQMEQPGNNLFVGHAGVLLPVAEDELYFIEKLAFQEPYQCVKFHNRTELSDYLMTKYDVDVDQPMAPPFIMENDQLMEGYGPKPETGETKSAIS